MSVVMTKAITTLKNSSLPDKLAEGLVVGEGIVVFLSKYMVNVLHAPRLEKLCRAFGLKGEFRC